MRTKKLWKSEGNVVRTRSNGQIVAVVPVGDDIIEAGRPKVIAEADDTARLIAAAPALAKALERLLRAPCCNEDSQDAEDIAAIRKAQEALELASR